MQIHVYIYVHVQHYCDEKTHRNMHADFLYRDGGGVLALSVYIRKLSFSPSISGQMDSYLYHCDYTIKAVKKWVLFDYGKGVKLKKCIF